MTLEGLGEARSTFNRDSKFSGVMSKQRINNGGDLRWAKFGASGLSFGPAISGNVAQLAQPLARTGNLLAMGLDVNKSNAIHSTTTSVLDVMVEVWAPTQTNVVSAYDQ